jgi:hypothetical protein
MARVSLWIGIVACCAFTACKPDEPKQSAASQLNQGDSKLKCAAFISSANKLVLRGEVENDPAFARRALLVMMSYLAAYAIPQGLKEADAFAELNSLRAELMDRVPPQDIMRRAKTCVDRSPASRGA